MYVSVFVCVGCVLSRRLDCRRSPHEEREQVPRPIVAQGAGYVPMRLMLMVLAIQRHIATPPFYQNVDLFSGNMAIARAFRARGLPSLPLDVVRDPRDDS